MISINKNTFKKFRKKSIKNGYEILYKPWKGILKIRFEKHQYKDGDNYCPRHHNFHFHIETYNKEKKEWIKILPPGYKEGSGTGFLHGDKIPGELSRFLQSSNTWRTK